jgi:hypothetical protein
VLAGSALTVAATLLSWLALVSVAGFRAAGFSVSTTTQVACGVIAIPIVLAAALQTIISVWRGPRVIAFERSDAVRFGPDEADAVRAAAQLRGTMGGAGYVFPARLAFPVVSWLGALGAGTEGLVPGVIEIAGAWPPAVAASAALVAWLFPSRPYWYREVTGGGVLVTPLSAAALVTARANGGDAEVTQADTVLDE